MVNGAAAGIVESADRERIWQSLAGALNDGTRESAQLSLTSGRSVTIRGEPIRDGARLVGGLVRLDAGPGRARTTSLLRPEQPSQPVHQHVSQRQKELWPTTSPTG